MMYKNLYLRRGKEESLKRFHPWIFSGAIHHIEGEPEEGEVVRVLTAEGKFIAVGHWQIGSIAVRVLDFDDRNIDADYWEGDNEGHIMLKIYNPMNLHSEPTGHLQVKSGEAIVQGVITQYYTCDDEEEIVDERKGGMGSTDKE